MDNDLTKAIELAEKATEQLQKSHVKQYTRSDGTVVQEHEDSRQKKASRSSIDTLKEKGIIRSTVYRFKDGNAARRFANGDGKKKMSMIVMGDDGHHWVVSPADGERLVRHGYEYSR